MQFERVNQYLQTGANIGVILSILFLALQVSRTEGVIKAQTRNAVASHATALLFGEASNADLASIVYRSYAGEELSGEDSFRLTRLMQAYFRSWEDIHYQYRVGLFDEDAYGRVREAWRLRLARPGVSEVWCNGRLGYSEEFVAAIDELLERKCDP